MSASPATDRRRFLGSSLLAAPLLLLRKARAAIARRPPYLQNLGPNSAAVLWTTDTAGEGELRYWREGSAPMSLVSKTTQLSPSQTALDASYWRHCATLRGLEPGTRYSYQVFADGQPLSPAFSFHTPGASGPFSFLVFGDSGLGSDNQLRLRDRMLAEQPDLVLHTGDLAYPVGSFESFQSNYLDVYRDLMVRVPFFPCPGNHGYMTAEAFPHLSVHDLPPNDIPSDHGRYYSFDWCGVHFIALDSNAPLSNAVRGTGQMLKWLENDLRRSANRFLRVAYFHHPPYGFGPNEQDVLTDLARKHLVPILEQHGVQLVLNGHEHSYQRSHPIRGGEIVEPGRGTVYVTTGGGGHDVYPVYPNASVAKGMPVHHYLRVRAAATRIDIEAVNAAGEVIDSFAVAPLPAFTESSVVSVRAEAGRFAAGGIVSIFGSSLARSSGDSELTANGEPCAILYASPTQVNAVLPDGLAAGEATLRLRNANGVTTARVRIGESAPAILSVSHADGTLVNAASPARPGEDLIVYAAGLGRTTPAIEVDGSLVLTSPVAPRAALAGITWLGFQLPSGASASATVRVRAGTAFSPPLALAVA